MICGYIENVIPVPYIVLLIDWVICQANVLTLEYKFYVFSC